MRDHSHWSIGLGKWGGVQVQLHLFFLLFAAFTLYLSWLENPPPMDAEAPPSAVATGASAPSPEEKQAKPSNRGPTSISPRPGAPNGVQIGPVASPVNESQDFGGERAAAGKADVESSPPLASASKSAKQARDAKEKTRAARKRIDRERVARDGSNGETAAADVGMAWTAIISLVVLFGSVLIHELGRRQAAIHVGGSLDQFVLWPLGGLGAVRAPADPRAEVLIHLSGPAANLATAAVCLLPLLVAGVAELPGLMHPLLPTGLTEGEWPAMTLKLGFWINWVLFLVNLIPAFPFDGGRALRAGLLVHWPDLDRRGAAVIVARLAAVAAILMLIAAWLVRRQPTQTQAAPAWFALVVLAIFLYFGGKQEVDRRDDEHDDEDRPFGYDFSAGYTSLEKTARPAAPKRKPGAIAQWRKKRREERERRQAEIEAADELRVDEILGRLHEGGKESLSEEDRAVLARVSARYRGRSEHGA